MTNENNTDPLFCDRCSTILSPGRGNLYLVRIEAVADPFPPTISAEDLEQDASEEIHRLLRQMGTMTEQELMDQVHRRLRLYLCAPCYARWIENPTGS